MSIKNLISSLFNINPSTYHNTHATEKWGNDYFISSNALNFKKLGDNNQKLEVILSNPAVLKVFALQCDLFSLGKIYVKKDGVNLDKDPFLDFIRQPNPFEEQTEFMWSFMFWNMLGNSYTYVDSEVITDKNKMYNLNPGRIVFPNDYDSFKDKIFLSDASVKDILDKTIEYRYSDGKKDTFKLKKIIHTPDMGAVSGGWFESPSRLDALYKIVTSVEDTLDSDNINIRFAGKWFVSGMADPDNVNQMPLSSKETTDIETKMNGRGKQVHAVKSMIDVKRFVDSFSNIKLGEKYMELYHIVGSMYNIPKDVLEAFNSSTYENQEKARGGHVSYCLQPKADRFLGSFENKFKYISQGKKIVMCWEHLPFMQAFARERAKTQESKAKALKELHYLGIPLEEINEFLGTNFTKIKSNEQG